MLGTISWQTLAVPSLLGMIAASLSGCGGGSNGPDDKLELKFECSDPPLGVKYDYIKYYNGTVACGNLLLESDIGGTGTFPWVPPTITLPGAEDGFYTLMYLDPDVDLPNNGSWPDVKTPGSKAPARHWVVGNIDADMLKSGDLTGATTVSKFKGPSPPWGSHRYGQFLFRQSAGRLNFTTLPSPDHIYRWDYNDFVEKHQLGKPVASNFHMTQHMEPRPKTEKPRPAPEASLKMPNFECSQPALGVAYDIKYYNGVVSCGNLLLESDIGGTHKWVPPKITLQDATPGFYTLIYIDPDVDLAGNGSWPDVTTPGSKAPARHWVIGNIDAGMLTNGDLTGATTVSKYKGPSPPWGSHRYGQFLFKQQGKLNFTTLPSPKGIYNWKYSDFVDDYHLGEPVASNFHFTQHMEPRASVTQNLEVTV